MRGENYIMFATSFTVKTSRTIILSFEKVGTVSAAENLSMHEKLNIANI